MGSAYDSDSSVDDGFTETNVLLGYASQAPGETNETVSKIGGTIEFLAGSPPDFSLFKCMSCKGPTVQLLQLNGELPDRFPGHERRLWVYICPNKKCRRKEGCVRAVRGVKIDHKAHEIQARREKEKAKDERKSQNVQKSPFSLSNSSGPGGMGEFLFGASGFKRADIGNDGSASPSVSMGSSSNKKTDGTPSGEKSLSKSFSDALKLDLPATTNAAVDAQRPPESWPEDMPKPFPNFYLADAEYEVLDPTPAVPPTQKYTMEVDDAGHSLGKDKEDDRLFESAMDSDFQKFADRVSQNPQQVIRYEFGGTPLLYTKTDAIGKSLTREGGARNIPRCGRCGAPRTFEVQLTPHAITELEGESLSLEGMDWGTIIVGVCEKDCVQNAGEEADYVSEWAGVQWEELAK